VDAWQIGLIVVIVAGLGLVIFGALWDRSRNRKRAAEMLAPPKREIPRFRPDAPAPHYLSDLQARRPPEDAGSTELSADERSALKVRIAEPDIVTIKTGYASKDFVTDKGSGWAVLDHPRILVCGDPVETVRELLSVLEPMIMSKTPLVIVAPRIADEVRATLEVNKIRRTMSLLALAPADSDLRRIAEATGAMIIERSDRQSGYVSLDQLGQCERWVSTSNASHVIASPLT
jgi:hypothetical protein